MKKREENERSSENKFGWTEDDLIFLNEDDEVQEQEKDEQENEK